MSTQKYVPSENIFKNEGEVKTFFDEGRVREFVVSKPDLKVLLKEVLQKLGKWILGRNLEYQEWRKNNQNGKCLSKYNRLFVSWVL